MFLHNGTFVIEVVSYTILDETCSTTDVLLIAVVTCDFVDDVSSLVQGGFRNGALVSGALTFRGVVGESLSEGVLSVDNTCCFFFSKNRISDPVV